MMGAKTGVCNLLFSSAVPEVKRWRPWQPGKKEMSNPQQQFKLLKFSPTSYKIGKK